MQLNKSATLLPRVSLFLSNSGAEWQVIANTLPYGPISTMRAEARLRSAP